jgi:predicted metal-dependent phosphoesterase TrpH
MQRPAETATQTRQQAQRQARHSSKAAIAAHPAEPESRYAGSGFSPFTYPNATRIARAAFRFDTGHSF